MLRKKIILIILLISNYIYGQGYRDSPYIDNENGTVTDKETKLIWQKCSNGQINNFICSGEPTKYEWEDAYNQCNSLRLAGKKWRVPTIGELASLNVEGYEYPSLDKFTFPNTKDEYWSSTIYKNNIFMFWIFNFNYGKMYNVKDKDNSYSYHLRCVSGGIWNNAFVDSKNGTVFDKSTKLLWQKCSIGQKNDYLCSGEATNHTWEDAKKQCKNLKLAGKKWRLPTIEELRVYYKYLLYINDSNDYYWSSSIESEDKKLILIVKEDELRSEKDSYLFKVRCITNP